MKTFKSKKRNNVGLYLRRKGALERLLIQQKTFVSEGKDKTSDKGVIIPFKQEQKRLETEILNLQNKLSLGVSTAPKKPKF